MSLLTIVQTAMGRMKLQVPTVGTASVDPNVRQLIALINEDGQELSYDYGWQALTNEANFATVNTQPQGSILSLTGPDFGWVLNETMWDRTQRRPVFGPKTPAEWQQLEAQFVNGPWWQYRIRGNQLLFQPAPPVGDQIFFEWQSQNWCTDKTGNVSSNVMTADTDVAILSERLLILGCIWRFKQANKLQYDEDYDKALGAIADAMSRDASKPKLNLGGSQGNIQPGVFVPAGNWGIP